MNVRLVLNESLGTPSGDACLVYALGTGASGKMTDDAIRSASVRLQSDGVLKSDTGSWFLLPTPGGAYRAVGFLGATGTNELGDREKFRRAGGTAAASIATMQATTLIIDATGDTRWPVEAFLEGLVLGQYRFDKHFKQTERDKPLFLDEVVVVVENEVQKGLLSSVCREAVQACEHANWARDLANEPPNRLTPAQLAYEAKTLCEHFGLTYDFVDEGQMAELGLEALLSVAKGSREPAKLVFVSYHYGDHVPTVALVGKGITFDTGGVSIKSAERMHEMKYDMCGAAAVLGAVRAVASTKPALNVIGVLPLAENVVGSRAMKPGDIVRAFNGKTIEIHNTDAEGRLILCDALAYTAAVYKPDMMIDLATLTGAAIVALGHYAAGMIATSDSLAADLEAAGQECGERLWRLPLWQDYQDMIKGTHADLCNIGPAREAGTIVGGAFLREFVGEIPWAHLDIAGTAWGVRGVPYWSEKHATGFGVRLLLQWIQNESAKHQGDKAPEMTLPK
ncbi:MAG: putative cytosol aminopeptidase [Candidatus Hydrogenedentota bacterium]